MTDREQEKEKAESDIEADSAVAGSREGKHGQGDGSYVGRSSSDDDFDAGQSGAEARSEQG
ncbi:hypothetical protein TUM20985_23700 [Mycobacterium antarcticum]|uniref:hypothetical protein n=1 Tax=unclassified Mycolicibacterium TaxID=2636767 RepID=UPI002387F99C|nr:MULTISPECIES: hypothetical protein [unclassified Mycolicibacterium]BDX31823.1 hypothetical protein TUM20985_23700 [Mycolicibacterium sp. TUM20985]GLP75121.1 hypothetical protein TUM20983_22310 [Mycolicibacterium sp. TUM20983]